MSLDRADACRANPRRHRARRDIALYWAAQSLRTQCRIQFRVSHRTVAHMDVSTWERHETRIARCGCLEGGTELPPQDLEDFGGRCSFWNSCAKSGYRH